MRQLKNLMNQIQMAANPQLAFNQLLMSNPQLQSIMTLIKQSGQSPEATFYALAKQYGIDPEQILNGLR